MLGSRAQKLVTILAKNPCDLIKGGLRHEEVFAIKSANHKDPDPGGRNGGDQRGHDPGLIKSEGTDAAKAGPTEGGFLTLRNAVSAANNSQLVIRPDLRSEARTVGPIGRCRVGGQLADAE